MTPALFPFAAPLPGATANAGERPWIEARVLQSVEDGTWLVSIGAGKTMLVRADQALEPGQRVWVAPPPVADVQAPPQPATGTPTPQQSAPGDARRAEVLPRLLAALAAQVADRPPEPVGAVAARVLEAIDAHASSTAVPSQAVAQIRAVLRPAAVPHEPGTTADTLRRAIEDGGSLFEARAARLLAASPDGAPHLPASDLRTLVGAVLARLIAPRSAAAPAAPAADASALGPAGPAEALRAALAEAGASALATQIETAAQAEAHGIWRVDVPLLFGDRHVHLACEFAPDREADGRGDNQPAGQLHVLVTPEGTSALEARFAWRGTRSLAVDVYVDSEARAAALAPGREALAERLREAGFESASVEVWTNPARIARWASRRRPLPPAGTALDTHA